MFLPRERVRVYGAVDRELHSLQLVTRRRERVVPFFLHPQAPRGQRLLRTEFPSVWLEKFQATPTSSCRTLLLADGPSQPRAFLKLSLGARISGPVRTLREDEIACALLVSRFLDTIPPAVRHKVGFDWFPETAGMVESRTGTGWLLRRFAPAFYEPAAGSFLPAFSLCARRGGAPPLLVEIMRRSRLPPERFVEEGVLRPYVRVLAYLLFEEGIAWEGHAQNVLFEVSDRHRLTGRILLRDAADASVNLPLRIARAKPWPALPRGFLPAAIPFRLADVVSDGRANENRPLLCRGRDTVLRWGLRVFVRGVNASLTRFVPRYNARAVELSYLRLWQEASCRYLGAEPVLRRRPLDLPVDEALAWFLSQVDWKKLGATPAATLPREAEPLRIECLRRRAGPCYARLETKWGDLYLDNVVPAYFHAKL